jgi:nitroreductase
MNLSEVFKKRRSIRNYHDKAVSSDIIQNLLNDSILAPSAGNEQPWRFIIVSKREMIQRISVERKKNILDRIASDPDDYAKKYEKMLQNWEYLKIIRLSPPLL